MTDHDPLEMLRALAADRAELELNLAKVREEIADEVERLRRRGSSTGAEMGAVLGIHRVNTYRLRSTK